jgi:hypothetical protein
MGHVMDALARLEGMAAAGSLPDDVARKAEVIAAGWWWNAHGDLTPDRLVLLVQELQRWCLIASSHYALRWDRLSRAGGRAACARSCRSSRRGRVHRSIPGVMHGSLYVSVRCE